MCGIAGVISGSRVEYEVLCEMICSLRHRGPDDMGIYIDGNVGLGHSRLSIMDPENGKQPAMNEDESVIVVFNGEIYNYLILRKDLIDKGHIIKNNSDTAILPHMYEEYGVEMFGKLNGQFAIAIWSRPEARLVLARDRLGEKPLYYYHRDEIFCFASETKAIFKSGLINARISPMALKQVFTYWTTLSNQSVFEEIYQVPQGSYLLFENVQLYIRIYWSFSYSNCNDTGYKSEDEFLHELDKRLSTSVKLRMMADVPISFYLSGGLDSSLITGIAAGISNRSLSTFSIEFDDINYNESEYQHCVSQYFGTDHKKLIISGREFPSLIQDVIFHTETPLLRSGALPMYALAKLVRGNDTKVVLSGEGSDELFGGYDIFREAKIREFCSRIPDSKYRSLLYRKVNNYVKSLNNQAINSLSTYYNNPDSQLWFSSHCSRWRLGCYSQQFFSPEYRERMLCHDAVKCLEELLPYDFMKWTSVQRAQYLEIVVFFSNYLLSSQGDRVSMASSVECRYPFLDYEIVDFAGSLPDTMKIRALNEKYIVKKLAEKYLPEKIVKRKKFPYRAPIDISKWMKDEYVNYILCPEQLKQYGIFNPHSTGKLLSAIACKEMPNERDCMLFMGILSTQVLYDQFVA